MTDKQNYINIKYLNENGLKLKQGQQIQNQSSCIHYNSNQVKQNKIKKKNK